MIDRETYKRLHAETIVILKDLTLLSAIAYVGIKLHSYYLNNVATLFAIWVMSAATARWMRLFPQASWPRGFARLSPALAPLDKLLTALAIVAAMAIVALSVLLIAARAVTAGW